MRRLLFIALIGAVAVLPPMLYAQRGAAARAAARPAPRAAAPARMMAPPAAGPRVASGARFTSGRPFANPAFFHSRFRHNRVFFTSGCFGNPFFCSGSFYPYAYYPYTYYPYSYLNYPFFWPDSQPVPQAYTAPQPQVYQDPMMTERLDRLTDEIERMREERLAQQQAPSRSLSEETTTVLVFRDGHHMEVRNYGIVGQTLWVFTENHAKKYAVSDLDLSATQAATEERGGEFALPAR